jgi:UDPglucose 6-dehydrogenase
MTLTKKTKITVVGAGYVGMSLAVLLARNNDVIVLDVDESRVKKINNRQSTIADKDIEIFLKKEQLTLSATLNEEEAYRDSDYILLATPTNYDVDSNYFDTSSVDSVVKEALLLNKEALLVIKSTLPIGHTEFLQKKHETDRIIFSPEFLREGLALKDNLYPSRIIIGSHHKDAIFFAGLLKQGAEKKDISCMYMTSTEAEAVKLFSNSYLAMRVAFFNELDTFAYVKNIDSRNIIDAVCLDTRIGSDYNNPSFGYGGYCLPKDTKQLLAEYSKIPQKLIQAIVSSNQARIDFISQEIIKLKPAIVGFYRLTMKEASDNFRSSAVQGIIKRIASKDIQIIIYEPQINNDTFQGMKIIQDFEQFKTTSDVIVANRMTKSLEDVKNKCFSRDLFNNN